MKFQTSSNTVAAPLFGAALFLAAVSGSQAATILSATLTSQDLILGEQESGGSPSLGYKVGNTSLHAGVAGGAPNRFNNNAVVGFTLPTLSLGESVDSATFQIQIATIFGTTSVSLFGLSTANPDGSGTSLFSEVDTGPGLIAASFTSTAATVGDIPSTSVTSFIQSFYSGGLVPSQSEVFFRLNPSANLNAADGLNRVSFTADTAQLSLNIVPEPSSAAALGLSGMLLLVRRRRRV